MRITKILLIIVVGIGCVAAAATIAGRIIQRRDERALARVERDCALSKAKFTAQLVESYGTRVYERTKCYATPDKLRFETLGGPARLVSISRDDKGAAWLLSTSLHQYDTWPLHGTRARQSPLQSFSTGLRHLRYLGSSEIDGRKCEGFGDTKEDRGLGLTEARRLTIWIDTGLNLAVKKEEVTVTRHGTSWLSRWWVRLTEGRVPSGTGIPAVGVTTEEYSDIRETKFPDSLFELPRGYRKYVRHNHVTVFRALH
jgi:hypothetical protein